MAAVSGTVYRYGSSERIQCATVKATASDGSITQTITDDDGDFTFPNLDPGKWSFVVLQEDSFPNQPVVMEILSDVSKVPFRLHRLAGQDDAASGRKFFGYLLIGLGGLAVLYIVLHLIFPLQVVGSPIRFALWDEAPWRSLEIILWGLAGVLVNKIITCSWYLRSQKFYREGVIMHIAHLAATPLLVYIAVLLLSMATINLTLAGGTNLTLDLNSLPILVAVSFLLGTSPWPLWNFIERSSMSIMG
jgi:hypothetical protein